MLFRRKFGFVGWFWVSMASLSGFLLTVNRHFGSLAYIMCVTWTVSGVLQILSWRFVSWELDAGCLRVHKLWIVKEIAWDKVTHVGSWYPKYISSKYLEVHYVRSGPRSDRASIVTNPKDQVQFLAALRQHAPQAEVDV